MTILFTRDTAILLGSAALFVCGNISPGEREDRPNRWVLVVFTIIGLHWQVLPTCHC